MTIDADTIHSLETEIARLKQELSDAQKREARQKIIQEHSFECTVIMDKDGYILDANETLLRVTNTKREEVIGTHTLEFIAPQSRDLVRAKIQAGDTKPYEAFVQYPDGTIFPALIHASNTVLDGELVRISTIRDITETKTKQRAVELAFGELDTIYSSSIVGIIMLDGNRHIRRANPQFAKMFGYETPAEVEGQSIEIIHRNDESYAQFSEYYRTTLAQKGEADVQTQFKCKDGRVIWVQVSGKAIDPTFPPDLSQGVIWILRDISVRVQAHQQLEQAHAELETFFNNSMVGIVLMREGHKMHRVNQRMADILGYDTPEEVIARDTIDLHLSKTNYEIFAERYHSALSHTEVSQIEFQFKRKDGSAIWLSVSGRAIDKSVPANLDTGIVWIFEDISDRKTAEQKLVELACMDPLTGISNRRNFMELGERELAIHQRQSRTMCVAMLDLDHFKRINDTCGHKAGDEALQLFTKICRNALRASDILGRLGGEEFALILPDTELDQAYLVAERIRQELQSATHVDDCLLPPMTVSIGITSTLDMAPLEVLLQRADTNLYKAKSRGRNQVIQEAPPSTTLS